MEIRNIAIIAHVDHGKTTLTDAVLEQTGTITKGTSMDNDSIEKERGITIYSKNAATFYKDTKINIVDTPGHADFGSEVERVLRSVDSVLLVVDAQEGPMPQTRFVLQKSLQLGLKPILVINKIDKEGANPEHTHEQVLELFMELGATDEQLDFSTIYAIGRDGIAKRKKDDEGGDITPLLDLIVEHVPVASGNKEASFVAQPFNLAYDNFLGRLAVLRVHDGSISMGDSVFVKKPNGKVLSYKITKLFTFKGVDRVESDTITAGDIAIIAGLSDVYIGDTIVSDENTESLPAIAVDEPTIKLTFLVNSSPFAGREGKYVTSRQIRERLEKELEVNVGLRVDFDAAGADQFIVYGRGELHIAILIENMRREGYELSVSQPEVIIKEEDGVKLEPFEEITIDVPQEFQGGIIERLSTRKITMKNMEQDGERVRLLFEGPSRGLFGYRNKFVVDTKGEGIMATRTIGYKPFAGEIERRDAGSMASQVSGKALAYALANLQTRGTLYIKENTEVYEGMVIGDTAKGEQMTVNPIKGKQLTNMRASGSDGTVKLVPPQLLTIESGLEIMAKDEYLEVTPESVRLRKKELSEALRAKAKREQG